MDFTSILPGLVSGHNRLDSYVGVDLKSIEVVAVTY